MPRKPLRGRMSSKKRFCEWDFFYQNAVYESNMVNLIMIYSKDPHDIFLKKEKGLGGKTTGRAVDMEVNLKMVRIKIL